MELIPQSESEVLINSDMSDYTYLINFQTDAIEGMCDGLDAVTQSIYKILNTERYVYIIYDRNYGIELRDLIGKPAQYAAAVIKGRIEEALYYDDRIKSVENFEITKNRGYISVSFDAVTKYGKSNVVKQFAI